MQRKRTTRKRTTTVETQTPPANAKICGQCGYINSFKRVKCEKCKSLLPEGKFERARRVREQSLKREQQLALTSNLFTDRPTLPDDHDDAADDPITRASKGPRGTATPGHPTGKGLPNSGGGPNVESLAAKVKDDATEE